MPKKIVIIAAFRDFRDEEYFVPKEILEQAGFDVKTASNKKGVAIGADGGEANVDFLISDIDILYFDAIVFAGGPGALAYLDTEDSYRVAKEAVAKKKILAAICIAPVILAQAGALRNKKATVWSAPMDKKGIEILKKNGATYEYKSVVIDGNIITANSPAVAGEFARAVVAALTAVSV